MELCTAIDEDGRRCGAPLPCKYHLPAAYSAPGGMSRTDHLLAILAEECAEIAQRAMKAQRFGLADTYTKDGETLSNAEFIRRELCDLFGVLELLEADGVIARFDILDDARVNAKKARIEKWLLYSAERGRLV